MRTELRRESVTVCQVGICGYGAQCLNRFLDQEPEGTRLKAVVARRPDRSNRLDELKRRGVEIYPSLEDFFDRSSADLVVINSPIQHHVPQSKVAIEHGAHVLCEKPISGSIQEALDLASAEERSGRAVGIGYQWSFSAPIQNLKADILAGRFGKPLRMKTVVFWPRSIAYFTRNDWVARLKASDGSWILDSPVNNATAHFLHNIFFLLGPTRETSGEPVQVQAELYRANEIENYDTAAFRCMTRDGVEILYYASHAVPSHVGPILCYEFEGGTVYFEDGYEYKGKFVARLRGGETRIYGDPSLDNWSKLSQAAEAARGGRPMACTVRTAIPQTLCANGIQDSMPDIGTIGGDLIKRSPNEQSTVVWVQGLQGLLFQCYDQGILPSEHGAIPWAKPGKVVDLRDYTWYPGGQRTEV